MKNEYSVVEAAKILGMSKQSLHSVIRQGGLKAKSRKIGKVTHLYIKGRDLGAYAIKKIEKLQSKMNNMRMDLFLDEGENEVS